MKPFMRLVGVLLIVLACIGCEALGVSTTRIADIQTTPSAYLGRKVVLRGVVRDSWKIPLVDVRFYTVKDATGELTVLTSIDPPLAGAEVTVRGRIEDMAVVAGRPIGLHLRETDRRVQRHRAGNAGD